MLRFVSWSLFAILLIVGLARATALRVWRMPNNDPYLQASVAPTLAGGDLLILWRATAPSFGDLVLCPEPRAPERVVIGRLVGEAGDRVKMIGANLMINNKLNASVEACPVSSFTVKQPETGEEVRLLCRVENLGGNSHFRGELEGAPAFPAPAQEFEVGPGQVFLASDNRRIVYDSRDFGLVDRALCRETVLFRLVSSKGWGDTESRWMFIH